MGTFLFAVIPFDLAVAIVYVAIAFTICTGLLERPRFMKESERKKYTTYPGWVGGDNRKYLRDKSLIFLRR